MSADLLSGAGVLPVEELPLLESAPLAVPRVNLLPPEIGEQRALRKLTAGLAAAVVACAGLVGGVYVDAGHKRDAAQHQVDDLRATGSGLQRQVTSLSSARTTQATQQASREALSQAMSGEVLYSKFFDQLRLRVPDGMRFTSVAFVPAGGTAAGTATGASTSTSSTTSTSSSASASGAAGGGTGGVGGLTISGKARSADLVASWLDTLSTVSGLTDPYLSSDTVDDATGLHNFTVTATVTSAALSKRFEQGN